MDANGGSSATIVRDVDVPTYHAGVPTDSDYCSIRVVDNELALVSTKADGTDQQTIITIADLPFDRRFLLRI